MNPMQCSVVTGILFSRKPCPETTTFTCVRCSKPVCLKHGVAQADKRLMCPSCDAYTRRDDDHDSNRSGYYRDRHTSDSTVPAATGAAAGAAAGSALGQEDRAGLEADKGWHGEAPPDDGGGSDDSGGFDAS